MNGFCVKQDFKKKGCGSLAARKLRIEIPRLRYRSRAVHEFLEVDEKL